MKIPAKLAIGRSNTLESKPMGIRRKMRSIGENNTTSADIKPAIDFVMPILYLQSLKMYVYVNRGRKQVHTHTHHFTPSQPNIAQLQLQTDNRCLQQLLLVDTECLVNRHTQTNLRHLFLYICLQPHSPVHPYQQVL